MTEEHNEEGRDATVYELGYHLVSTIAADDLETEVNKIRKAIEKRGGSFITEGTPEALTLAFPMFINKAGKQIKHETAYFGWIKFEMEPEQAVALRTEDLAHNENLLRILLIVTTREETRAQLQSEQNTILREVKTTGVLEKKHEVEEGGEVSEEELEKSIDDLVGEDETK